MIWFGRRARQVQAERYGDGTPGRTGKTRRRTLRCIERNSGLVVAVAALVLAVWAGLHQQAHDRLSVRPYLIYDNVTTRVSSYDNAGLYVNNSGSGLAIVEGYSTTFRATPKETAQPAYANPTYPSGMPLGRLVQMLSQAYPELPEPTACISLAPIAPGKSVCLVGWQMESLSRAQLSVISTILVRLSVKIQYKSLYGEKFETESGFLLPPPEASQTPSRTGI